MQKGINCLLNRVILKPITRLFSQRDLLRKVFISCCLLLLINPLAFAQVVWMPGFIITQDSDTIHGLIESRETKSLLKACHFKENEEAREKVLTAADIQGYRFF